VATLAHIWRYPIKSHGREALDRVDLTAGQTMPWDRTWAVAHEAAKIDGKAWAPCNSFSIVSKAPLLMAMTATLNEDTETVTLRHPSLPDLTISPDSDGPKLIEWARPLMPKDRAASARVVRVPGRGMTDTNFPSISIGNIGSHRAFEQEMGRDLSIQRWRCNIWLDGLAPWEEFDLIGKSLRIGGAEFIIRERTRRCMATTTNPETGFRDADTLKVLNESYGHQDFCVYAEVTKSGEIANGDKSEVL